MDTPGSGRVYDRTLFPLGLGGLVYTSSGADKTERAKNYYLKHKRTLMSVPRFRPISVTSWGNPSYPWIYHMQKHSILGSITTKVSYHQLPSVMLSQVLYCPHGPGTPAMLLCEPPTERTSIWPSALTLLTVLHRRRALRLQRKDAVEYPVFCTINSTGERTFYSRTGS